MCNLGNLCFTICAECKFIALILTTNPRTCVAWKLIIMVHCLVNAYTVCVVYLWLYLCICDWLSAPPVDCQLQLILFITNTPIRRLWAVAALAVLLRDTLYWVFVSSFRLLSVEHLQHLYWSSSFPFRTDFFSRSCCFLMSLLCWTSFPSISSGSYVRNRMNLGPRWFLCWLWSPFLSWCGSLNKLQLIFMNNTDNIFSQTTYGK